MDAPSRFGKQGLPHNKHIRQQTVAIGGNLKSNAKINGYLSLQPNTNWTVGNFDETSKRTVLESS